MTYQSRTAADIMAEFKQEGYVLGAYLIDDRDYHSLDPMQFCSSTLLKDVRRKSPLHAKVYSNSANPPSESMRLGTAIHCALFEPERFSADYIEEPEIEDKRKNPGRKEWEEFKEKHADKIADKRVLSSKDLSNIVGCKESILTNIPFFTGGHSEVSLFWPCRFTGIQMKAKVDYLKRYEVIDLKTTGDASAWVYQTRRYNLGLQMSHYSAGFEAIFGFEPSFTFVVAEREPPHGIKTFIYDSQGIGINRDIYKDCVQQWAACLDSQVFPGYTTDAEVIGVYE